MINQADVKVFKATLANTDPSQRIGVKVRALEIQTERRALMSARPILRMPGEGKTVTLAGQPMVFLVTGEDSKHACTFEWTVPPGFSTGLHVHRVQEETFYVLEGQCEWKVGDELIHARPGTYIFIPPGVPHNIGNASDKPARLLMTVSPPGHEHYFEELAKLTGYGHRPDANAIADLRRRYDTDQLSALRRS